MKYEGLPWKVGDPLPFLPGDTLYYIDDINAYSIRSQIIDGVALYADRVCPVCDDTVFAVGTGPSWKNRDDLIKWFFTTEKSAHDWISRNAPPRPWTLEYSKEWVSTADYAPDSPGGHIQVYIKVQTDQGIQKREAIYDDGSEYPEDRGYWTGTGRHSQRIDNVIAWISGQEFDQEK